MPSNEVPFNMNIMPLAAVMAMATVKRTMVRSKRSDSAPISHWAASPANTVIDIIQDNWLIGRPMSVQSTGVMVKKALLVKPAAMQPAMLKGAWRKIDMKW